jgi:hypothetical protein
LIELNPLGRWTVKIATNSTTIMAWRREAQKPAEDKQSADHLDENRRPAEKEREWHANRVQDANEDVGATGELA